MKTIPFASICFFFKSFERQRSCVSDRHGRHTKEPEAGGWWKAKPPRNEEGRKGETDRITKERTNSSSVLQLRPRGDTDCFSEPPSSSRSAAGRVAMLMFFVCGFWGWDRLYFLMLVFGFGRLGCDCLWCLFWDVCLWWRILATHVLGEFWFFKAKIWAPWEKV